MKIDELVSLNIKKRIRNKYTNISECAKNNKMTPAYLINTIGKIKKGKYPSIKRLKKIAEICECSFTDFFEAEAKE